MAHFGHDLVADALVNVIEILDPLFLCELAQHDVILRRVQGIGRHLVVE